MRNAHVHRFGQVPSRWLLLALLTTLLQACGGGGGEPSAGAMTLEPAASPAEPNGQAKAATDSGLGIPGTLHSVTPLGAVTAGQIVAATAGSGIPALQPVYDVQTYRLNYTTSDGRRQPVLASALLAMPDKAAGAKSPVISYQHPTIFMDAQAPSNNPTATEASVVLASMGYIVIAADYVGYGASKGLPHPYLMSTPTAAAVVDLMDAAGRHFQARSTPLNGQLFLVGYSEGAYATVAAQRALQARGDVIAAAVVGSVPGSGPLDVGATLDELLRRVRSEVGWLAWLVDPDLLQFLSADQRRQVRDEMLRRLIPQDADVLFQSSFIDNFLANDRVAITRDSDVHDWRPAAPMRLFHGRDDQTVPFIASQNARLAMQARGAPHVQLAECGSVPSGHLQCVAEYWQFVLSQMGYVVRDL